MEDEGTVEVCIISKGPPILQPLTITMATVTTSSNQGMLISLSWSCYLSASTILCLIDTDFVSSVSDMNFVQNQSKACTQIHIVNDTVAEKPEYFYVFLLPNEGVKLRPDLASVKIVDDDGKYSM